MIATLKAAVWRSIRHRVSASSRLQAWLRHALGSEEPFFASGHFYSPVVDRREATAQADALWPDAPSEILGIDFDPEGHQRVIDSIIRPLLTGFDYFDPATRPDAPLAFPPDNDQFGGAFGSTARFARRRTCSRNWASRSFACGPKRASR